MAERLAPSTRHAFTHHGRLVYEWDQALAEVNMYIPVPPDLRAKEIFCDITKQHLKFGRHGNTPFMDVSAGGASGEEGGGHDQGSMRLKCPSCVGCRSTAQSRPAQWGTESILMPSAGVAAHAGARGNATGVLNESCVSSLAAVGPLVSRQGVRVHLDTR